jgi:hypothetical protein
MSTPKSPEQDKVQSDDTPDVSITLPLDTDDNNEPDADASGDSEDETPGENEAPETWLTGEF